MLHEKEKKHLSRYGEKILSLVPKIRCFWLLVRFIRSIWTHNIDLSLQGTKLAQCKWNISSTCIDTWSTVQSHVIHTFLTSASGLVRSRSVTWDTVTTEPSNAIHTSSISTYTHQGRTFIDICKEAQKNAGRNRTVTRALHAFLNITRFSTK